MRGTVGLCFGGVIALSIVVASAKAISETVSNNGQTMTSDVKVINGKVYVPLNDVAKSLGEIVVKTSNGYALTTAGGANQIANKFTGKVGDTIFTGQFRLTVTGVDMATTYAEKYQPNPTTITADPGQKFVIVHCRIKNGTPARQEIPLSTSPYSGNDDTTLTDDQANVYQPINYHGGEFSGYDVHPDDTAPTGVRLLPGAAVDFVVVFNVPASTNPKDFIFGISKYDRVNKGKQTDVRVALH